MSNYSKRKGIVVSIIISLVIWISLNFILIQFNENQKKEVDTTLVLKTSQVNPIKENVEENIEIVAYKESFFSRIISKIKLFFHK